MEGYDKIGYQKGFEKTLLTDTQRIPVTEDYTGIYTYLAEVEDVKPNVVDYIMPVSKPSDLNITEYSLENSYLFLKIENGTIYINGIKM